MKATSVALATLLASSACGNKAPELVTSAKPDTALPSLADLHAPDAQASGPDAQATGHDAQAADGQPNSVGEPTRPADAIAVEAMHPIYAPLFGDQPAVFTWSFEVDTHDAEAADPVASIAATLRCRPAISTLAVARLAHVTCVVSDKQGSLDIAPALEGVWIATADGLWRTATVPDDPAALAEILKSKPFFEANPKAYLDERPGDPDKALPGSSTKVARRGAGWCRTDETVGPYGPNSDTWCLAPGRGITNVEIAGRSGPSTESYRRK